MTEDLVKQLMAAGLSKQQASSVTAETLVRLFMKEDGKILIKEAQRQVTEMQALVDGLKAEYDGLLQQFRQLSETLLSVTEAQKEHGSITDDRAKNVVALYGALLSMNIHQFLPIGRLREHVEHNRFTGRHFFLFVFAYSRTSFYPHDVSHHQRKYRIADHTPPFPTPRLPVPICFPPRHESRQQSSQTSLSVLFCSDNLHSAEQRRIRRRRF